MLIALGVDFRRAPLAVRGRLQLPDERVALAYRALRRRPPAQAVLLGTCNRTEIVAWLPGLDPATARRVLKLSVARLAPDRAWADAFLARAQSRTGRRAAEHVLRVAAGLESRILGDAQILSQVRAAYQRAMAAGGLGPELHRLFQTALRVGRRVHAETGLLRAQPSAGRLAADLVARRLGCLAGRRVVVIGAGKTARAAARRLHALGAEGLEIVNRTPERAAALAREVGAASRPFAWRHEALASADAALVATASPTPIVLAQALDQARLASAARGRPLLLGDLSVPRNVEPAVSRLAGLTVVDLDQLAPHEEVTAAALRAEVPAAEGIVAEELEDFMAWLRSAPLRQAVSPLRQAVYDLCRREVAHVAGPEVADRVASRVAARLLASPLASLRAAWDRGDAIAPYAALLERLFTRPA